MRTLLRCLWVITLIPRFVFGALLCIGIMGIPCIAWDLLGYIVTGSVESGGMEALMGTLDFLVFKEWDS